MAKTLTVFELTRQIKSLLEDEFGRVMLQGEISGLARPSSGHLYFTIKDSRAQIAGVMFKTAVAKSKFELEDGLEVILKGRVAVYEPRGSYQLIVERIEPVGEGALQLAFEQLKVKLEKRGWFKEELKKKIPFLPTKIGIVTSQTGAALQDMLQILGRRFPAIPVLVAPAQVQGEGSKEQVARQIEALDARKDIDLILLGRGGGSLEDLWAFNEEAVVEAIYKCATPIISAVGHETDFTLADFVADLRAPTPSAAAELAVPLQSELLGMVEALVGKMRQLVTTQLSQAEERLLHYTQRLRSPEWVIQSQMQRLDEIDLRLQHNIRAKISVEEKRLVSTEHKLMQHSPKALLVAEQGRLAGFEARLALAMQKCLDTKERKIAELAQMLQSLSPLAVLGRGYSLALDEKGKPLEKIEQFEENKQFRLKLQDGEVLSTANQLIKQS